MKREYTAGERGHVALQHAYVKDRWVQKLNIVYWGRPALSDTPMTTWKKCSGTIDSESRASVCTCTWERDESERFLVAVAANCVETMEWTYRSNDGCASCPNVEVSITPLSRVFTARTKPMGHWRLSNHVLPPRCVVTLTEEVEN